LLTGKLPFDGESNEEILKKVVYSELNIKDKIYSKISAEGKNLLMSMLVKDPAKRCSAPQALGHVWFKIHSE